MQQNILERYKNVKILIAGQLFTSRTETLEEYYRDKVKSLGIIGIVNPYFNKGFSRYTIYENSNVVKDYSILRLKLKGVYWFNQLLLAPVFTIYTLAMLKAVLRIKKKYDIFIGIAAFSCLFGVFLKKIGIVKNVIYYTLDYYPKPRKLHVNTLVNKTIWYIDRYCCKKSLLVWNISQSIIEAREKMMNFHRNQYRHILVPLTYSSKLLSFRNLEEIEMNTLVFVGTLSKSQGLQLVIESLNDLILLKPDIKIRVIGSGPDEHWTKNLIKYYGLNNRFIFHGFIKKDKEVRDIISRCGIGICTWTDDEDNNVIYADPGKPKLYAFCGIPIIITKVTAVAQEIDNEGAGVAINYNKQEFVNAVLRILKDKETLERYRKNAHMFASRYTTETLFESVSK